MPLDDAISGALSQEPNQAAPPAPAAPTPAPSPAAATPPVQSQAPPVQTPAQQPAQEPQPPALIHPAHRSMFGAIASALIGSTLATTAKGVKAVAGPQPARYVTDESGRVVRDPQPADTTASRLQRLAENALLGLAYGAQAGPQKSAAASWAAGIGAGAVGVTGRMQQQDLLKRQQATEEYERTQRALANRATIWAHNIQRYRDYLETSKIESDMNPEYQQTQAWKDSIDAFNAENPASPHEYRVLSPDQAQAFLVPTSVQQQGQQAPQGQQVHTADSHPMGNWVLIGALQPIPLKDNNGQPFFNQDGSPKMQSRVLIASADESGVWPVPQTYIDNLQKYGDLIPGNVRDLKAGQGVNPRQFALLNMGYMKARQQARDAWEEAKILKRADGTEVLVNPVTNETREAPPVAAGGAGGLVIKLQQLQDELSKGVEGKRAAGIAAELQGLINDPVNAAIRPALQKLQQQARAAAKGELDYTVEEKQRQEAVARGVWNPAGSEELSGEAYLKSLPSPQASVLTAIAEGRETRSARQLQDKNGNPTPLALALHRAYPDFDDKKAIAYGALVKDFTTGATSRALTAYGTAINHARAMYDNTGPKSYVPTTDEYKRYNQDVTYVATEVAKALNPTGVATEGAIKEQEDALRSTFNRKAAIENAAHILTGKMAEIKQRWANGQVRPSYQPLMPGLSKEAMDNADYIRNHGKVVNPPSQNGQKKNPFRTGQ